MDDISLGLGDGQENRHRQGAAYDYHAEVAEELNLPHGVALTYVLVLGGCRCGGISSGAIR